jgi:tRNA pseudouridine38-40 synthase
MADSVETLSHTRRFAACVEYDGTCFSGWQIQEGTRTVQQAVEGALSFVANHPVRVVCAGRTDTGVHACGQIVHFDSPSERSRDSWLRGANTRLPPGVVLNWVCGVDSTFHARFKARRRRYRYIILNQPVRPALLRSAVSWEYRPLDASRMVDAAKVLIGRHDFSAFRATSCQAKNPVKTIHRLDVMSTGNWIWLDLEADGFLHHMVRNIAGVLMQIARGERDPQWCREVLESLDRRCGGVTAPACGLYLTGVGYDPSYPLPSTPPAPRFW